MPLYVTIIQKKGIFLSDTQLPQEAFMSLTQGHSVTDGHSLCANRSK